MHSHPIQQITLRPTLWFMTVIGVIALTLSLCGCDSQSKFVSQVKSSIDPKELQKWAVLQAKEHQPPYEIPEKDWPKFLLSTNGPSSAWVGGLVGETNYFINVAWGGGFGHRGLMVGDTNFVIKGDDHMGPAILWIPGVYITPKYR